MAPDPIKPFHDSRVSLRSINVNGYTYGYIYAPRSTSAPNRGTIFLIHGFPDFSFGWRYQIPYLASLGLDVIAPDTMGYGRTNAPPDTLAAYSYRRIADDVASMCKQLGLSQIVLGGHDWGGAIAWRIALYHRQLIKAVFVLCTPYNQPIPTYTPLKVAVQTKLPNFGYQLHFASGDLETACGNNATGIRQFLMNLFGARTPKGEFAFSAENGVDLTRQRQIVQPPRLISDHELDFYVQEFSRHGLHGPLNWYRTQEQNFVDEYEMFFDNGKNVERRVQVEQEALFVLALKDQALRPWMAEKMKKYVPRLTKKEIDAGHWVHWERAEEVNETIGSWLKEKVFNETGDGLRSKL